MVFCTIAISGERLKTDPNPLKAVTVSKFESPAPSAWSPGLQGHDADLGSGGAGVRGLSPSKLRREGSPLCGFGVQ